jgi:signal transduction histidine kinase
MRDEKGGKSEARRRFGWKSVAGMVLVLAFMCGTWLLLRLGQQALAVGPRAAIDPSSAAGGLVLLVATLLAFGLAVNAIGARIRRRYPRPFADLREAIRKISTGDFDVEVDVDEGNPFGAVAGDLNEMARALKRMEEMRQDFVSTASHEIQSPLTSIAGFARILREEDLDEEGRRHYLSIIEEESARLSRLSESLIRLSYLESKGRELELAPVALDAQIRKAVLAAEPQWAAKRLEPVLELDKIEALADEAMLAQVWTNLLHNAIKFSREGGRLSIGLRASGGRALARFEDEGVGLASEDLDLVFDRFFKADRARTNRAGEGSGLGLAIVKKIVELHGGSVRAESKGAGRGSAFVVELPLGS